MKNYSSNWLFLVFILIGLSNHNALSPIMIALGIIFAPLNLYKNKQINSTVYSIIIVGSLTLMIIVEYLLIPLQNISFYLFLIMIALGIFLTFYFSVISNKRLVSKAKTLAWTGAILFAIGFFGVFGIILNNLTITLIMIVFILIVALICLIIRRNINKDNILKNEFSEVNSTQRDDKGEWFKFKVSGIPKPVRWQGWASYIMLFISPLLVTILDPDRTTGIVIIFALITIILTITILKINYRESAKEYRENLRKQAAQQESERDEVQ